MTSPYFVHNYLGQECGNNPWIVAIRILDGNFLSLLIFSWCFLDDSFQVAWLGSMIRWWIFHKP